MCFGLGTKHNERIHSIWIVGIFTRFSSDIFSVRKFRSRFSSLSLYVSVYGHFCLVLIETENPQSLQVIDCIK